MKWLIPLVLALVSLTSHGVLCKEPNIIEQFEGHVAKKEWSEALPLIEELIRRSPKMATSWRNYGVVLDELARHAEAADAFKRAYVLEPGQYRHQYRAFRSLALAGDEREFAAFVKAESRGTPEIFELLLQDEVFDEMTATAAFKALVAQQR